MSYFWVGVNMPNIVDQRGFFKELFREVILEVMHEEKINFYDSVFPSANKDELADIETLYG